MHVQLRLFRYRVEERAFGRCFIVWKAYHGKRKRWVPPLIFDVIWKFSWTDTILPFRSRATLRRLNMRCERSYQQLAMSMLYRFATTTKALEERRASEAEFKRVQQRRLYHMLTRLRQRTKSSALAGWRVQTVRSRENRRNAQRTIARMRFKAMCRCCIVPAFSLRTNYLTPKIKTANAFIRIRTTATSRIQLRKTVRMLVSRFRRDALSRALLYWSGEAARARQEEELNEVIAKTQEQHSRILEVVKATRERRESRWRYVCRRSKALLTHMFLPLRQNNNRCPHHVSTGNVDAPGKFFQNLDGFFTDETSSQEEQWRNAHANCLPREKSRIRPFL